MAPARPTKEPTRKTSALSVSSTPTHWHTCDWKLRTTPARLNNAGDRDVRAEMDARLRVQAATLGLSLATGNRNLRAIGLCWARGKESDAITTSRIRSLCDCVEDGGRVQSNAEEGEQCREQRVESRTDDGSSRRQGTAESLGHHLACATRLLIPLSRAARHRQRATYLLDWQCAVSWSLHGDLGLGLPRTGFQLDVRSTKQTRECENARMRKATSERERTERVG